jgi:hypothetical protein
MSPLDPYDFFIKNAITPDEPKEVDPKLKRAQSLVGTSAGRPDDDFYPTPPEATLALLANETFVGDIWEPACGDGAISRVLEDHGFTVKSTDLNYRGYGVGNRDFLHEFPAFNEDANPTNIITNPPFKLAEEFIWKSLEMTADNGGKVAMLCKLQFLEGIKRKKMFEATPLARVHVFSKRITMWRNGEAKPSSSMIAFAWFVWDHKYKGEPIIRWI